MIYQEKFGVKVDIQIPQANRTALYEQWERWKEGATECYLNLTKPNLMTRY